MAWSGVVSKPHDPRLDQRLGNPEWVDNWTVGEGLRMEFIDAQGQVWLCHEPVTEQRARSLSLPDGASFALFGGLVADTAYFSRSPLAEADGPLDTMEVDGLRFSFVARPIGNERVAGATLLSVDKRHAMLYGSGRSIEVLDFGDGTLATPAWSAPNDAPERDELDLPDGWKRRTAELTSDFIAVIPNPAKVVILNDGSGFHGPLPISQLESACR